MECPSSKSLSPQEMKAIGDEISQKYAPAYFSKTTEIVILPVDPYHLHAYWALADDKAALLKRGKFVLRVHWLPDGVKKPSKSKLWFDIGLKPFSKSKKITLLIDDTWYLVEIGIRAEHKFTAFAVSNTIHVPRARLTVVQGDLPRRKTRLEVSEEDKIFYDEALIDAEIKKTLAGKNMLKVLDLLPAPREMKLPINPYDEESIDAEIRAALRQKRIAMSLENPSQEITGHQEKSQSGQGINASRL
ncbi:MAG TPA: DUF4912 domain-containing protein [Methylothermaceae bacterium]|nr:DUF4912 domain-containing protein [Methylothermaceae bacterium]